MAINQLSVFAENRYGTIRNVAKVLGDKGVDIRALSVSDTEGFGVLRLIVSDLKAAKDVLADQECIVSVTPVLGIVIPDRPGGLSSVLTLLSDNRINIEYLYAFITRTADGSACVVLHVKEMRRATTLLTEAGISLLTEEQLGRA